MQEQDFSKRITIVVRKDLKGWEAANTIAHIAAYIGHKLGDSFGTGEYFGTSDTKHYPRNTQYPIIIKRATSSEQLHTVLENARDKDFLHYAFVREMIERTNDAEIEAILAAKEDRSVEILGIGFFGTHEEVNLLTKKFGLWE